MTEKRPTWNLYTMNILDTQDFSNLRKRPTKNTVPCMDDTRISANENAYQTPFEAFWYTLTVDKGPSNSTKQVVSKNPYWEYHYAVEVENLNINTKED